MVKSRSLRIFSFMMAFLMMTASTGFSMDVHYCAGKMKRASVFGKAMTCAEVEAGKIKCGKPAKSCSKEQEGCCDNTSFIIDFDFDSAEAASAITTDVQKQLVAYSTKSLRTSWSLHNLTPLFLYRPPPLIADLRVVYQSFRC